MVQLLEGLRNFSLLWSIQTDSGGHPDLTFNWLQGCFLWRLSGHIMRLTCDLHHMPRLRMTEPVSALPHVFIACTRPTLLSLSHIYIKCVLCSFVYLSGLYIHLFHTNASLQILTTKLHHHVYNSDIYTPHTLTIHHTKNDFTQKLQTLKCHLHFVII